MSDRPRAGSRWRLLVHRPKQVDVYGPGDYADPVDGVAYGGPALVDVWPPAPPQGGEPKATK